MRAPDDGKPIKLNSKKNWKYPSITKTEKQITRAWDILKPTSELPVDANSNFYSYNINNKNMYTHILHDKGRVGVFLKGFIGYNSNPNWAEVCLWALSLFFGIRMWRKFYFKRK